MDTTEEPVEEPVVQTKKSPEVAAPSEPAAEPIAMDESKTDATEESPKEEATARTRGRVARGVHRRGRISSAAPAASTARGRGRVGRSSRVTVSSIETMSDDTDTNADTG